MNSTRTEIPQKLTFPLKMAKADNFDLTFKTYFQPLCYFLSKNIPVAEAEDIVEELFIKIWNKKPEFSTQLHLQAFLYRSAENARLDFLKSHRYAQTEPLLNHDLEETDNYAERLIRAEVYAEIYRAIHLLPSQCNKVISMSFIEGLTNAEIAELLGLNLQTVKNHKLRGLKILKEGLSGGALLLVTLVCMKEL